MLRGSSFCYICLDNDRHLINMYRPDSNKVKLLDMLTYLSFETSCIEEDIPMYICDDCHKHLRAAYDLKVKCQKNNIHVRRYIFYLKQFTHPTTFTNEPVAKQSSVQNAKKKSTADELITINMDLTDLADESDVETEARASKNEQNTTVTDRESEISTSILSKRPEFNTSHKQSQLLNVKNKTKICSVTVINHSDSKLINSPTISTVSTQTRILSTRPEFNIYKNISQSNCKKSSSLTAKKSSAGVKSNSVNNVTSSSNKVLKKSSKKKSVLHGSKNKNLTNHTSEPRSEFVEFDIISTVKLRKRGIASVKPPVPVNNPSFKKPKMQRMTYNVKKDKRIIQRMNRCKVMLFRCQIAKKEPLNTVTSTTIDEPNLTNKDPSLTTTSSVEIKQETNSLDQNNTLINNPSQEQSVPMIIKQEIDDNETNSSEVDLINKPVVVSEDFSIKIEIIDDKTSKRVACYGTDKEMKLETISEDLKNRENVASSETEINSLFSFSNAEFLITSEQVTSPTEDLTNDLTNKDTDAMFEQGNCKATVSNASKTLDLLSVMSNADINTTESDISGELIIDEVAASKKKQITKISSPTTLKTITGFGKKSIFKRFLNFTNETPAFTAEQEHFRAEELFRTDGTPAAAVVEAKTDLSTVHLPNYKFPVSKRVLNFSVKEQTVDNSAPGQSEHRSLPTNVTKLYSACKPAVGKPASHLRVAQLHNEHCKVLKTLGSPATKVESLKSSTSRRLPRKVGNPIIIGTNVGQTEESPVNFMAKQMKLMNKYMNPLAEVGGITTKQPNTCVLSTSVGSTGEETASNPVDLNLTALNDASDVAQANVVHLKDCNSRESCKCFEKSLELVSASKITIKQDLQPVDNQSEIEITKDRPLKCPTCNKHFHSKLKLKKHALIHKNFYHCPICKVNFTTKTKFKLHMLIHEECKHKCFICDTRTLTNKSLEQHYKTEHKSTKLCTKCKLIFTTDGDYVQHMQRHDSKRTCTVCNRSVAQKTFRSHMKSHERSKCSLCDKYFDVKQLNEHNCTEQWEKTYKCTECERTFYFQPSLAKHMMVHYEMQCFLCKTTFAKPHAIVEHMSKHIGPNGYQCPLCEMSTFSKDNMKLHMTAHYGRNK